MSAKERKRNTPAGRSGKGPSFLKLPHWIIQSDEFAALTGSELKMLIDVAGQFKGNNNGDLSVATIMHRWKSRTTAQEAKDGLIAKGWIARTRAGGLRMGPDLFAVTWLPIDECKGRHHVQPEKIASHAWSKTKRPVQKLEQAVPETGTGNVAFREKVSAAVPETGTVEAVLKAA